MGLKSKTKGKLSPESLEGRTILNAITPVIAAHLPLMKNGEKNKNLVTEIISCPICDQTVHSASKQFQKFHSETDLFYHLNKCKVETIGSQPCCVLRTSKDSQLYRLDEIQHKMLWACVENYFDLSKEYVIAIDETQIPTYPGETDKDNPFIIGGKVKKSTNTFYTYAALSIVSGNMKVTLSLLPVTKNAKRFNIVKQLIEDAQSHGLRINYVLMDRGYYIADLFDYLKEKKIGYITPVKLNSQELKNQIDSAKKTTTFKYHMKTSNKKDIDVNVVVVIKKISDNNHRDRAKYGKFRAYSYVCSGVSLTPNQIFHEYEHRFVIESEFRIMNLSLVKTCSRNPAVRYLFTILSFCLQNMWRVLQAHFFTKKQRGPKVVDEDKFRYNLFIGLIYRAIGKRLKFRDKIPLA